MAEQETSGEVAALLEYLAEDVENYFSHGCRKHWRNQMRDRLKAIKALRNPSSETSPPAAETQGSRT